MSEELTTKDPVPVDETAAESNSESKNETNTESKNEKESNSESKNENEDKSHDDSKVDVVEELEAQQAAESKEAEEAKKSIEVPPTPPPKPPRPASPFTQAENQLKEAFPGVEASVIKAVLVASKCDLDSAFTALLSMSDPNFKPEAVQAAKAPAPPPPQARRSQIEEDERLARELARQYNSRDHRYPVTDQPGQPRGGYYSSSRVRNSNSSGYSGRYDEPPPEEPERSFFDDDLPEIRKNLQEGFNETRDKVTSWMNNLRKRLDGEEPGSSGNDSPKMFGALGRSSGEYDGSRASPQLQGYGYDNRRRRADGRYYDRDPAEISDDFQGISLRDDTSSPPAKPPRPSGNVSAFGETTGGSTKNSKWEPLKSSNNNDDDKDPFFIGESDDDEPEGNTNSSTTNKK